MNLTRAILLSGLIPVVTGAVILEGERGEATELAAELLDTLRAAA